MKNLGPIALILSSVVLFAADSPPASDDIKTEFEGSAILTKDQMRIVQDLALRAGLPSVGEIYTYNIHPGPSYAIGVLSKETVNGREIRTSSLSIGFDEWNPHGSKYEDVEFRSGAFWVYPSIYRSRFATFGSPRSEKRIGLSEQTSPKKADEIFALFAAGKIRFKDPSLKKRVDEWRSAEFTITKIHWEADDQGTLDVAVRDRHAYMSLMCSLQDGWITVIDVRTVIS